MCRRLCLIASVAGNGTEGKHSTEINYCMDVSRVTKGKPHKAIINYPNKSSLLYPDKILVSDLEGLRFEARFLRSTAVYMGLLHDKSGVRGQRQWQTGSKNSGCHE
ncbi:hypothetical protein AVEN_169020-1 [Araneus ventricosus]|uniref:Uncharacterized protein n=1 Tax=Araneus ventricosus TaxID=182803 RepID=A0A4Y2S793_ARAVE|nr:hypothetical protein AVEN_169020-1 [Araneus ventricosus]